MTLNDKTLAPPALLTAIVLALCVFCAEAVARSDQPQGCSVPPASSLVVNVKDKGAKGDGHTNDTAAIQAAIDAVAGKGGTVIVPDGTYLVDAIGPVTLTLKSDMTLELSPAATLKAIPNGSEGYSVLTVEGVSRVAIVGGKLEGERDAHVGKAGQWGMGIRIGRKASHVTVSGVTAEKMWGDGFYVDGASDVKFCAVTADRNRRQGLSVIDVDGLLVVNSVFSNTKGTLPSAGIDMEPDGPSQTITNVRIQDSKFLNNAGAGILIQGKKGRVAGVEITHNVFRGALPIKIKAAPGVLDSKVCRNRHIAPPPERPSDLTTVANAAELVVVQDGCGDRRLVNRK